MHQVIATLAGGTAGCALILLFYTAVRTQWPANYASSTNDYGMVINRSLIRYLTFALAPTYVISLLVSTTVSRVGGYAFVVAGAVGIFHAYKNYIAHIRWTLRHDHSATRYPTVLLEVTFVIGVLSVAMLAGLGPGPLGFLVPPIDEFFKSLWTTVFLAILGVVLLARTRASVDIGRLIRRSRQEVGSELIRLARRQAASYDANPDLVEAVLLTENLQRPRWFRSLERIKGRLFPVGSYGVMQVHASKPLSDRESITLAISEYLSGATLRVTKYGSLDYGEVRALLERYNDNPNFVQVAVEILSQIWHENHKSSSPLVGATAPSSPAPVPPPAAGADEDRVNLVAQVTHSMVIANMLLLSASDSELRQLKSHLDGFIASVSPHSASLQQKE